MILAYMVEMKAIWKKIVETSPTSKLTCTTPTQTTLLWSMYLSYFEGNIHYVGAGME